MECDVVLVIDHYVFSSQRGYLTGLTKCPPQKVYERGNLPFVEKISGDYSLNTFLCIGKFTPFNFHLNEVNNKISLFVE